MVDFARLLPPEQREAFRRRIAAVEGEMERLHGLPDRWLGEAILKLVREVRTATKQFSSPGRGTYNDFLLWQAVPEVARRLGCRLLPNEAVDPDVRGCSLHELRNSVSLAVIHADRNYMKEASRPNDDLCPVDLLLHESANGNPVAIALDRVAPPMQESNDRLAQDVREISKRRGHKETSSWHPDLQRPAKQDVLTEEPEEDMDAEAAVFAP